MREERLEVESDMVVGVEGVKSGSGRATIEDGRDC